MPHQRFQPPAPFASELQQWPADLNESRQTRPYVFNWRSVAVAALVASLAITFYMMLIPRWLGIEQMDIGITIGAMADPAGGPVAFLARVAWHVGNGIIYVPIYAAILVLLRKQSCWGTGVVFGVVLWLAGPMLLVPVLLNMAGDLNHPGIFMLTLGLGWKPAAVDLGAHLTHGILAGVICKHRLG
jgi:hypothetical protein